jgi:hypothetical protein
VSGRIVGVVLNAVDLESRNYGYYRYYQYKHEGYGPLPGTPENSKSPDSAAADDARS